MSEQTTETRYFGYAEAATYIGVSIATLRRMVDAGQVRASPLGGRLVRFDRQELDRLVRGTTAS